MCYTFVYGKFTIIGSSPTISWYMPNFNFILRHSVTMLRQQLWIFTYIIKITSTNYYDV